MVAMVPATGLEPARPGEDFGFKDRCVYHFTTRAWAALSWIAIMSVKSGKQANQSPQSTGCGSDQSRRFIETARELGCDEDEAAFDEKLKRIAQAKSAKRVAKAKSHSKG